MRRRGEGRYGGGGRRAVAAAAPDLGETAAQETTDAGRRRHDVDDLTVAFLKRSNVSVRSKSFRER